MQKKWNYHPHAVNIGSWRVTPRTALLCADRTFRQGNPCTDKVCHLARFPKDASCPLSGEGNWTSLFQGERMSTCKMRQACVSPLLCACDAFVCAWQWQTADQRGGVWWLTPALSDWQRKTHHHSSSLVINSICLFLKVEVTLSAGCRYCFLKAILHNGGLWSWWLWPDVKEMVSLVPHGGQSQPAIDKMWQLKRS